MAPPVICCSAEDAADAESMQEPNARQVVRASRPSNNAKVALNSLTHMSEINQIFAAATESLVNDRADTATTSSRATRQSKFQILKKRFSKDSAALGNVFSGDHVQRKAQDQFKQGKRRLLIASSEADIFAARTPSHGGYDKDAHLLDDTSVAANARAALHDTANAATSPSVGPRTPVSAKARAFTGCSEEDDVFTSPPLSSSGAPRLLSITSESISMHWPHTPHAHQRQPSEGSDIASAVEELFPKPRRSEQGSRSFSNQPLRTMPTILASDLTPKLEASLTPLGLQSDAEPPSTTCLLHGEEIEVGKPEGLSQFSADTSKSQDPDPQPRPRLPLEGVLYRNHDASASEASLHLYTMRISQHLRSLSNLSTDSSAAGFNSNHSRMGSEVKEPLINQNSRLREYSRNTPDFGVPLSLVPEIAIGTHGKKALALNTIVNLKPSMFDSSMTAELETPDLPRDVAHVKDLRNLDGPTDTFLLAPEAQPESQQVTRPRQKSIGENYNDTAGLWGKALGAYADVAAERRRGSRSLSSPSKSRWNLALHGVPGRPSLSPRKSSAVSIRSAAAHHLGPKRSRAGSILELKPLQTQHTFDKLAVGHDSSSERNLTYHGSSTTFKAPFGRVHGRRRSKSHSHLGTTDPNLKQTTTKLLASDADRVEGPTITITDTEIATIAPDTEGPLARHRSGSSLAAWSRYPTHTRHERSFSAGMLDSVIARDFADAGSPIDDNSDDATETTPIKKPKSKIRGVGLRRKFLTDLPKLFKPHRTAIIKPARGHRSSIAAGAPLEFPELELISGGAMSYTIVDNVPERDRASHIKESPHVMRKGSLIANASKASADDQQDPQNAPELTRLGSSNYGSMVDRDVSRGAESTFSNAPYDVASDWPGFYASAIDLPPDEARAHVEQTPLFLAPSSSRAGSLGAKSLPPRFEMKKTDAECDELRQSRKRLRQSISAQPMRRSTKDLLARLDMEEEGEMARALRTAETVWAS